MDENKNPIAEEEISAEAEETVAEEAAEIPAEEPEMATDAEPVPEAETAAEAEEAEAPKEEKPSRGEKKKQKKLEAELGEVKKALIDKDNALAEMNDKYLRVCAEYDNFRKRSAKEREGIYADACGEVLTQILPILDNLERAAQYNTEDVAQSAVGKGLEMVLKSFLETLEKLGVSEIEALGKPFDPNVHNAVMHIDDEQYGENEVVEVLMKGYVKGDRVLRYTMVKVAN